MADRLHLLPKHRQTLEALLREHLPDVEVWAYGSRVNGRSHDGSDLDLVLRGPGLTEIPIDQLVDFEEAMRESSIPFLVEARDWARLPERFHPEIERDYVVLENTPEPSPEKWPLRSIEEISEKVAMGPFGSSIKVSTFVSEGVPVISGQHLHQVRVDDTPGHNFISAEHAQKLSNANVQRGDIIFTHAGNIGQVAYIPETSAFNRYIISQRQFYMRCDQSKAVPEFIANYFKSPEGQHKLLANASQVGVPSIAQPVTYLRTVEVPLPPLSEQHAIARILGTLDDKIELNRRMNETLETMARATFKDWFVDFGPTRAKAKGCDPYLAPKIWDLFPDRLVDSELGEMPDGWAPGTLGDVVFLNPESWGVGDPPRMVAYVDLKNTKWGCIGKAEMYAWEQAPSRARRVLRRGDTILATVRPGNGSFALIDEDGLTGSTGFAVLRPREIDDRELVWCTATSSDSIDRLTHLADGGAYPAVRPDAVLATPVVLADRGIREAFSSSVGRLIDWIEMNKRASGTLASLRNVLLPKLVSGEIRIADAEKMAEAVA